MEEDLNKRNKNDFVLWFTKSKFEDQALEVGLPLGRRLSRLAHRVLRHLHEVQREYLDLHCGGIDNAFPTTPMRSPSLRAYLGHPWCKQWFHVHHLNTAQGKMSKSKGEFLTVSCWRRRGMIPGLSVLLPPEPLPQGTWCSPGIIHPTGGQRSEHRPGDHPAVRCVEGQDRRPALPTILAELTRCCLSLCWRKAAAEQAQAAASSPLR